MRGVGDSLLGRPRNHLSAGVSTTRRPGAPRRTEITSSGLTGAPPLRHRVASRTPAEPTSYPPREISQVIACGRYAHADTAHAGMDVRSAVATSLIEESKRPPLVPDVLRTGAYRNIKGG